jgi:hypothetical protein
MPWRGDAVLVCWLLATSGCTPHAPYPAVLAGDEEQETEMACRGRPRWVRGADDLAEAVAAGERDAVLDLARGVVAIEAYDLPRGCRAGYEAGLSDRHGILLREVGRCTVDDAVIGHARGYNARMRAYIEQRHGAGLVESLARSAGCLSETTRSGQS